MIGAMFRDRIIAAVSALAVPVLAVLVLAAVAAPMPAQAQMPPPVRFYAYDPDDALTQGLTRGITLQVEPRFLGGLRVQRLFSTTSRGSAGLEGGGPSELMAVLPAGSTETNIYRVLPEGDGRALANALCPGSTDAWIVTGRVRLVRPLVVHAVGRWADGRYRHCARLSYQFRGEWAAPPRTTGEPIPTAGTPLTR
jgi:hypothetical protein